VTDWTAASKSSGAYGNSCNASVAPDHRTELSKVEAEPLLPIEKKLIGWSLGIGLTLLVILAIVNHYLPAAP